ncbi:hypothetical protein, partial [Flavobacterium columnare]|uniref:hypothetical protein n=2 Tax=Flavobacterium columnare TaxID=996 RepID=UPI001B803E19
MQNCKVEKLDFIETNRIIKNFNLKKYFIFIDKQELIENSCLSKLYTQQELDSLTLSLGFTQSKSKRLVFNVAVSAELYT